MQKRRRDLASLVDDFERLGRETAIVAAHGLRRYRSSYGEVAQLARRFACELTLRGIQKGDRVLLCGENGVEWVACFFGCVLTGVLAVPLDAGSSTGFLRRVEQEVSPKLRVVDAEKADLFEDAVLLLSGVGESITVEEALRPVPIEEQDPFQIIFTSGTTGEPKGIVHTHRNVLASLQPIEDEMQKYLKYERFFHPLRFLHTLPLSHVFGQFMGLWIPGLLGAEVHYESRLVPAELIARVHGARISVICAVPRVLAMLKQHAEERFRDLPGRVQRASGMSEWLRWWRFRDVHGEFGLKFWAFVCGGAALPPEVEQFWKRLGFVVIQGYGMTETTALVSLNHPFKAAQGTIGQVLPGREVKLGEDGEVLVRGDTISDTIWQGGAPQKRDSEWLATGDLAEFDENGNLRFRSRKKDVIVTAAGLNIYPEDLESALRQQAGVRDVAVIEANSGHGPEPVAVLLLASEGDPGHAVAAANRDLAEFQQVRRWIVWPQADFPRTSTGKVLKREIAPILASAAMPQAQDEVALDSLGRVELQAELEQRYGITLDEAELQNVKTAGEVQNLIARAVSNPSGAAEASRPRHAYHRWPWNPLMEFARALFIEAVAMPIVRFLAAPKRRNRVRELPKSPALIVANHITSYDVPFILFALPHRMRIRCAVAMSGEMLLDMRRGRNQGSWFLNLVAPVGYLLITALFNVFPLPQRSGFQRSFRHAGEAVDRGYNVIVFPEGRRSDDGTPQPFMKGAGLLWKELSVPAVAVHIEGLGELKRRRSGWFRSGKVSVGVEAVLKLNPQLSPDALTQQLQDAVFATVGHSAQDR